VRSEDSSPAWVDAAEFVAQLPQVKAVDSGKFDRDGVNALFVIGYLNAL
jgi:hypothetical protein